MASKYGSRRNNSSFKGALLASAASFLIGGALAGYFVWQSSDDGTTQAVETQQADSGSVPVAVPSEANSPTPTPLVEAIEEAETPEEAVEVVTRVAEQQGGIEQRLAAAEQRLTILAIQAQSAEGNTTRAEGLLIAFAARRFIERGEPLNTYLEDQLRLRFADKRPNAVNTVINFSRRNPIVRVDRLLARLEGLGPQLKESNSGISLGGFTNELGDLFSVRRQSTPSPQPERRLERARFALEQGRYQRAQRHPLAAPKTLVFWQIIVGVIDSMLIENVH